MAFMSYVLFVVTWILTVEFLCHILSEYSFRLTRRMVRQTLQAFSLVDRSGANALKRLGGVSNQLSLRFGHTAASRVEIEVPIEIPAKHSTDPINLRYSPWEVAEVNSRWIKFLLTPWGVTTPLMKSWTLQGLIQSFLEDSEEYRIPLFYKIQKFSTPILDSKKGSQFSKKIRETDPEQAKAQGGRETIKGTHSRFLTDADIAQLGRQHALLYDVRSTPVVDLKHHRWGQNIPKIR
ncbi:hypothetical protein CROQUDRAFT_717308 [Cronartium quercuum f. sp. fusiforme G11]|uniref:Uncharacterized protein n=1 Tax=Cronartium quercuum f. sp. fusiforme G11 TaxID=708437 RepID=A0A9P6NBR3_9BASI|nr:hypothetical protein CROQUDRAFT_717308 [Cronartium quercuum f. sp. fusiforme G11]